MEPIKIHFVFLELQWVQTVGHFVLFGVQPSPPPKKKKKIQAARRLYVL
jgi:hypothetical protein